MLESPPPDPQSFRPQNKPERSVVSGPLSSEVQMAAMTLRFEGFRYSEINRMLKEQGYNAVPSVQTLRHWFMKGGLLETYYDAYCESEGAIRRREAADIRKARLSDTYRTLVQLMTSARSEMVRLLAAKELADREEGKAVDRMVGSLEIVTTADLAQRARAIIERHAAERPGG